MRFQNVKTSSLAVCWALALSLLAQDVVAQPSLSLDPSSGPAGSVVQATGEGFLESPCGVNLYWDSLAGQFLGFAATDDGFFSTPITIPTDATLGEHTVIAQGLLFDIEFCDGPSGEEASAPFTVVEFSPPSFSVQTFPVGEGAKGVATGDFNGDGILDLVVANAGAGTVTLLTELGDGIDVPRQLGEVVTIPVGKEPRSIIVADFDSDELLDFAVTNFGIPGYPSTISVLFQDAEGFTPVTIYVGKGPSDLVAGYFDQDKVLDLAVANTFSDTISIILGVPPPARGFSGPQSLEAAEGPQSIASGDFNGDDILDLVVANLYSDDVTLFLGDGQGGFKPSAPIPPPEFEYRRFAIDVLAVDIAVGDLNGDDTLDLAWVNTVRPQVEVLFGDGLGGFVGSANLPVGSVPRAVAIADVNADGVYDIAVVSSSGDEVSLLLGSGRGTFAGPFNYTVGDRPQDIAVAAFNLDPGLDLFVTFEDSVLLLTSPGSPPIINAIGPTQGPLAGGTVLLIDGANFTAGATLTIGGTPVPATDLLVSGTNRIKAVVPPGAAGAADIAVTTADGTDTAIGAFTYTADPIPEIDLRFTRLVFCNAETGDQVPDLDACLENSTKDSDVADIDGDDLLDIYAAKTTHHGDHGGGIDPDEVYFNIGSTGPPINGSFVDDLGVLRDVTVETGLFDVTPGVVTNDPDNKVQYDIQIADLDDDGDLDVVAMHTDTLRILINDGFGTFTDETSTHITGLTPDEAFQWDDVDIGDVDNDGDLDIIGASRWDHGAGPPQMPVLLLNDGTAHFAADFALLAAAATAEGLDPEHASHDVDLADIDNDGDLDVIFTGTESNEDPRIFINTLTAGDPGSLSFQAVYPTDPTRLDPAPGTGFIHVDASRPFGPTDAPDPANKRRLKPLDFNGDGYVDLYFGAEDHDQVYINRGAGNPGFFTRLDNVPFPYGVTYGGSVGDLDLDGRTDIVEAEYYGEPMIYLNRIVPGTAIDDINASPDAPFVAIPEPMRVVSTGAVGSRRDGLVEGSYWQSVSGVGLDEPDVNGDEGLTPGTKTGFLGTFSQILDVDLGDFDQDGDLDIIFSLGDHQERANRIFLNNTCDTATPEITCPPDVTVTCGKSTDPANTGMASAPDICDLKIDFVDNVIPTTCPADPIQEVIERTWTATNNTSGNSSSCDQTITVLKKVFPLDIKPGSCPNSYNRRSHGVLPVGLLGTADFDVTTVDLNSVVISRADCIGGAAAPNEGPPGPHSVFSDVGTPFPGVPCDCHELTGDGVVDLSMKFPTDDVVDVLELNDLPAGALVELVVSGTLADGCKFIATDCVRLVPPRS